MTRHVALLRAINVGSRNKIPMGRLRTLLDGLGYTGVRTYLQSGNAVLTASGSAAAVAGQIEAAIADELELDVTVLVRTRDEIATVIERNPLASVASDPTRYLVTFLAERADPARLADLDPASFAPEEFRLLGRELYAWCPNGIGRSKLLQALTEKRLGAMGTARNWKTVAGTATP